MGKQFESISNKHMEFIRDQKIFFVGTAAAEGKVNVSPKGMDTFRVINENKVVWLNLTGSGNETAAHLLQNNRITIMFCAFEGKPEIIRLYGKANVYHQRDAEFDHYMNLFGDLPGKRQIIEIDVDLVQSSCGYAVPKFDFVKQRSILKDWAAHKGEEGIKNYWSEKNTKSIDGFETGIL